MPANYERKHRPNGMSYFICYSQSIDLNQLYLKHLSFY